MKIFMTDNSFFYLILDFDISTISLINNKLNLLNLIKNVLSCVLKVHF